MCPAASRNCLPLTRRQALASLWAWSTSNDWAAAEGQIAQAKAIPSPGSGCYHAREFQVKTGSVLYWLSNFDKLLDLFGHAFYYV